MTNGGRRGAGLTRSAPDEITDNQNISIVTHFLTQSPPYHQREGEIYIYYVSRLRCVKSTDYNCKSNSWLMKIFDNLSNIS